MIATPQLTNTEDQHTACIHLVVPRAEIRNVMGPAIREVFAALAAQGIAPAGPWLTHHIRRPADVFDFDVCVPVQSPVSAAGRVTPGLLAGARVAKTSYSGSYEGLGDAWGEFMAWISAQGLAKREDLWECYVVGPETSPDPATWRTVLYQPLAED